MGTALAQDEPDQAWYHLASLWKVRDRGSRSLRTAQLQLMRDPASAHPYYWAPLS